MNYDTISKLALYGGAGALGTGILGAKFTDDPDMKRYMNALSGVGLGGLLGGTKFSEKAVGTLLPKNEKLAGHLAAQQAAQNAGRYGDKAVEAAMDDLEQLMSGKPRKVKKPPLDRKAVEATIAEHTDMIKNLRHESRPMLEYDLRQQELQKLVDEGRYYLQEQKNKGGIPAAGYDKHHYANLNELENHLANRDSILEQYKKTAHQRADALERQVLKHRKSLEYGPAKSLNPDTDNHVELGKLQANHARNALAASTGLGAAAGGLLFYKPQNNRRAP